MVRSFVRSFGNHEGGKKGEHEKTNNTQRRKKMSSTSSRGEKERKTKMRKSLHLSDGQTQSKGKYCIFACVSLCDPTCIPKRAEKLLRSEKNGETIALSFFLSSSCLERKKVGCFVGLFVGKKRKKGA